MPHLHDVSPQPGTAQRERLLARDVGYRRQQGPRFVATTRRVMRNSAVRYVILFTLFFALLYLRRSAALLHPQVWDEDGTQIIPGLLSHGLRSLFYPVSGYLILLPKLISVISLSLSGLYYPLVSTTIAWIFIVAVCIAISVAPTWLRGGTLLGVATLLIPSDPEVFGVSLYSLWWAGLLLFLVVLWEPGSKDVKWRVGFTVLGGLSSPIIFLTTFFLVIRAAIFRKKRRELAVLATALFCCCMQAFVMLHSSGHLTAGKMDQHNLREVIPKFIGDYLAGNYPYDTKSLVWFAAGILVGFLLVTIPFLVRRPQYLFLIGLWAGSICMIANRIDLSVIHQRLAGPRYFFFPFVLVSWFLVSVLVESERRDIRLLAGGLLLVSALNMFPVRSRPQRDFHWAEHLSNCGHSEEYSIPISWDGETAWFLKVDRGQCMALQRAGLINMGSGVP